MFIRNLYAIKDVKSGFCDPCVQHNDAVAGRGFTVQARRMADELGIPLRDLQLWRVGVYDQDSGKLLPEEPVLLVDGATIGDDTDA